MGVGHVAVKRVGDGIMAWIFVIGVIAALVRVGIWLLDDTQALNIVGETEGPSALIAPSRTIGNRTFCTRMSSSSSSQCRASSARPSRSIGALARAARASANALRLPRSAAGGVNVVR